MKLTRKLFISYVLVLATGILVVAIATAYIAPLDFSHRMSGPGRGPMMNPEHMQTANEELEVSFRNSVNAALLGGTLVALIAAGLVSWFVSQQIVHPIRDMVRLSSYIADGHYQERLKPGANDELGELIHSFNQMAESLYQTENMRQQLMADITHELKTPLASIKGYMEGLQDEVIPATPETYQLVHREAGRLQSLVNDLQELSRVQAGQAQFELQACDPIALTQTAIERLRPQFIEKGINLKTELPDKIARIHADYNRTVQVLINLMGNALQYTSHGGEVRISVTQEHEMVHFAINDNGIGLSEADLKNVFQRFYRVDKSRARSSGGSGIGLTISRHIIESQSGRIWAESAGVNQGSTFHFMLPITH